MTIARRAIAGGSVEITRCVVAGLGLPVTKFGRNIAILRGQSGLPASGSGQLVGSIILAVLGRLGAIFSCDSAVVDRPLAVISSPGTPRGCLGAFVRRVLAVASRAISCGSIEITGRVVARLSLPVAEPSSDVTVLRSQPSLPATHACQLIRPGIRPV